MMPRKVQPSPNVRADSRSWEARESTWGVPGEVNPEGSP